MKEVTIRDVEADDLPEIKKLIDDAWDFGDLFESEASLDTALGLYFNQVLYDSSFGKAAVLDGKVVGVIFGYVNGQAPKFRMMLEDPAGHIVSLLNMTKDERQNVKEFMTKLNGVYSELIDDKIDGYDGTLDFLVISQEAQGLKIGRKLWDELSAYFKETKAGSIYVFTDTECNFGFYEHIGFSRKGQRQMTYFFTDEKLDVDVYLYDYKFDKHSA